MVQTEVVVDDQATGSPEVAVAVNVGAVPKVCGPGVLNVIVWEVRAAAGLAPATTAPAITVPTDVRLLIRRTEPRNPRTKSHLLAVLILL